MPFLARPGWSQWWYSQVGYNGGQGLTAAEVAISFWTVNNGNAGIGLSPYLQTIQNTLQGYQPTTAGMGPPANLSPYPPGSQIGYTYNSYFLWYSTTYESWIDPSGNEQFLTPLTQNQAVAVGTTGGMALANAGLGGGSQLGGFLSRPRPGSQFGSAWIGSMPPNNGVLGLGGGPLNRIPVDSPTVRIPIVQPPIMQGTPFGGNNVTGSSPAPFTNNAPGTLGSVPVNVPSQAQINFLQNAGVSQSQILQLLRPPQVRPVRVPGRNDPDQYNLPLFPPAAPSPPPPFSSYWSGSDDDADSFGDDGDDSYEAAGGYGGGGGGGGGSVSDLGGH